MKVIGLNYKHHHIECLLASLAMSTSVLKALPGKLDIKRHSPSILYLAFKSLLTVPRRYVYCGSFVLFMPCVCHAFASVHYCLVVTCLERADLLALVCDVLLRFRHFPFGILGRVWYLIVLIPDLYHLSYF